MTCYQGRHRARVFRLYDAHTAGHRPLTTGPSGALHSALLKWIVSRASGVYREHVRVVRIHPRYRGTPPDILTSRGFFYPLSIEWHLSVHSLPSSVPETSCIYAGMVYSNCALELYGVIHALLLSYLLTILQTSSSSLRKVSTFSQMSKKGSLHP